MIQKNFFLLTLAAILWVGSGANGEHAGGSGWCTHLWVEVICPSPQNSGCPQERHNQGRSSWWRRNVSNPTELGNCSSNTGSNNQPCPATPYHDATFGCWEVGFFD